MQTPDADQSEKAEPHSKGITTQALLSKLPPFVSARDLKNERDRGFLPPLVGGKWTEQAVQRAKHLYRLRALGAEGTVLKILLFLADGWGWDEISSVCVSGLERIAAVSLNGVAKYENAKGPLDFYVEEIAAHQHKAFVKKVPSEAGSNPTSNEMTAFVVGMLKRGAPLEGGSPNKLMVPLAKAAWPSVTDEEAEFLSLIFGISATLLDLRASEMVARLLSATDKQVERGRKSFKENARVVRIMIRNIAGPAAKANTNILTGFGHARDLKHIDFSQGDIKLSNTFVLAGLLGFFIAVEVSIEQLANRSASIFSNLVAQFTAASAGQQGN